MSDATERNKARVREAIEKVVNGGDAELADAYYREDYIQHNPHVGQGREALKRLIRAMHASGDPMRAEIELISAEGDLVWLLLAWSGGTLPPGMPRIEKTAEVFRLEDGMLAEHWDVVQVAPEGR